MPADRKLQQVARAICSARNLTLGPEVGAGAFKHTFEVRTAGGAARALKVYRKAGADARTQREVDAITRCSHPGIARFELIETWKDGAEDYVYSLEEFLAGGTLTDRLRAGSLSAAEVRDLATHLVDAVGHIASLALVHRDLKPDNIMFRTAGGPPVIVDFGLVRDLSQEPLYEDLATAWSRHPVLRSRRTAQQREADDRLACRPVRPGGRADDVRSRSTPVPASGVGPLSRRRSRCPARRARA